MTRNRGAAIIVQEGKIALIKRVREDEMYFVFPGGGIEEGETPEEATRREVYPALTGSKTPTSKFSWSKEVRWEINCP
ncbi:hypothetical protein IEQ_02949 [Bacillus cereus BAG6X1-2]|nr:hypothetical protein IEQ_02949 [Bacillus cereus BAG6X1-2]